MSDARTPRYALVARELVVAVSHVPALAEHRADEVLHVAGKVRAEIPDGVRDAGRPRRP